MFGLVSFYRLTNPHEPCLKRLEKVTGGHNDLSVRGNMDIYGKDGWFLVNRMGLPALKRGEGRVIPNMNEGKWPIPPFKIKQQLLFEIIFVVSLSLLLLLLLLYLL